MSQLYTDSNSTDIERSAVSSPAFAELTGGACKTCKGKVVVDQANIDRATCPYAICPENAEVCWLNGVLCTCMRCGAAKGGGGI